MVRVVAMICALLLVGAACGSDGESADPSAEPESGAESTTTSRQETPEATAEATAEEPAAPEEQATPGELAGPDGWILPGLDYDNSRAALGGPINASNVTELTVAWTAEVSGPLSTVPLIVDGTVFVQDGSGVIAAIDAKNGEAIWTSESYGFNIGPFGVAVDDGRVFGLFDSAGVVALDAATGEELWIEEITATETTGIDIQPVVYDGMVLVSTVPVSTRGIYTGGDRGVLHALDAETGEVIWTFDTVESDDLWGNPDVNSGGGSWYPPAIDPDRGVVYWGVANPAPFPGTAEFPNGTSRPGPNLYTNSAVALDVATGELAWYHQVIPHDLFDRDLVHTLISHPPGEAEVVIATGKGGTVVGLDPETGEPLWETSVGLHENDDLEQLDGPTVVAPGTFGGVITPPATADGVVYVATLNAPSELSPDAPAYFAASMGVADGEVAAIDALTGEIVWSVTVPGDPLGGITVVNDLVLTALLSGEILALDRASGDLLWQEPLPGGTNGWMSVHDDLVVVPAGNASPPQLVAYRLPGS